MDAFHAAFQPIWTVLVMITFLGIVAWAWNSRNQQRFDEAAKLPFDEDELATMAQAPVKEKKHV